MRKATTLSLLLLFITVQLFSQPGSLNTSFGSSGFATINFADLEDYGYAMAVQSDGKIIAAGSSNSSNTDYAFSLARLNPDGSFDNSFGTGGKIVTPIGISASEVFAVAIQSDGKIIAAGYSTQDENLSTDFTLVRYNTDGSLDNTFGIGGIVTNDFNVSEDQVYSIAVQADGKILATGPVKTFENQTSSFGTARYNTDGSLDNSFGNAGLVMTALPGFQNDAYEILVAPGNKIIVAGRSIGLDGNSVAIAKYNLDGSPDNSFGNAGLVIENTNLNATTALLQADGKIVVASSLNNNGEFDFGLARFNADGTIDNDFGVDGIVSTNASDGNAEILSLVIQSDAKIIATGHSFDSDGHKITLARYLTDGTLDNSFGDNGIAKPILNNDELGYDVKLYGDKIFIVGSTTNAEGDLEMLVSSLNNDGFPPSDCTMQVSIPDASALSHGVALNTVYPGYSPAASITLTANATGGDGNYTYLWSTGLTSQIITVSPVSETTYTVTVTDGIGCMQTASKTINVINVDCGNGKATICHFTNDPNHAIDICVGQSSVAAHLAQGCSLGECSAGQAVQQIIMEAEQLHAFEAKIYPNPSRGAFTIIPRTDNINDKIEMRIIDVSGRLIEMNKAVKPNQSLSVGQNLKTGIYFVELRQGGNVTMKKLVKL